MQDFMLRGLDSCCQFDPIESSVLNIMEPPQPQLKLEQIHCYEYKQFTPGKSHGL